MTTMPDRNPRPTPSPGQLADPCGDFSSASITIVLDAPGSALTESRRPEQEPDPTNRLPRTFRSSLDPFTFNISLPSLYGLKETNASGSAQYSKEQMEAVLESGLVRRPLMVVDLRQESHGFLRLRAPLHGESTIAVGWFVERDWINVGKGLPSIDLDQRRRFSEAVVQRDLVLQWILTKTAEDGICTARPETVHPAGFATEQEVVEQDLTLMYLRLPTTDHLRPRDAEVDEFVRVTAPLHGKAWLHFHCRGGDGRTTTFMVMHDIMCNAPHVPVDAIVRRQYLLGGEDLDRPPDPTRFAAPFAIERRDFVRAFYDYVCEAKRDGFTLTWSKWIDRQAHPSRAARAAGQRAAAP